ncbi:MAG: hypothetical protein DRJ69_06060, partial [Thermoprotei archaeon]
GQRRLESFARARAPPVAVSRWVKGSLTASPINEWSALHVWLYLMREGVEANPLYARGFDRVGCWLCPASELAELKLVEELHPELWERWSTWLKNWASQRGLPERWVELGLWRWRRLPGDQRKLAERAGLSYVEPPAPMEVTVKLAPKACLKEPLLEASLSPAPRLEAVARLAPTVRARGLELKGALLLKAEGWSATLSEAGGVKVKASSLDAAEEGLIAVVKLAARSTHCSNCGSCVSQCPAGCTRLDDGLVDVDAERCTGCGTCNQVCPAAVYVAGGALKRALPHRLNSR